MKPEPARLAERAGQRAADLRRDADAAARPLERDAHGLERLGRRAARNRYFTNGSTWLRRRSAISQPRRGASAPRARAAARLRQPAHAVEVVAVLEHDAREEPARDAGVEPEVGPGRDERLRRVPAQVHARFERIHPAIVARPRRAIAGRRLSRESVPATDPSDDRSRALTRARRTATMRSRRPVREEPSMTNRLALGLCLLSAAPARGRDLPRRADRQRDRLHAGRTLPPDPHRADPGRRRATPSWWPTAATWASTWTTSTALPGAAHHDPARRARAPWSPSPPTAPTTATRSSSRSRRRSWSTACARSAPTARRCAWTRAPRHRAQRRVRQQRAPGGSSPTSRTTCCSRTTSASAASSEHGIYVSNSGDRPVGARQPRARQPRRRASSSTPT